MADLTDLLEPLLLAFSAFFVVLAAGLLLRYKQASQKMTESSELGRDLWVALQERTKKQDERIVDLMTRFDVIQSRFLSTPLSTSLTTRPPSPTPQPPSAPQTPLVGRMEPESIEVEEIENVESSREDQRHPVAQQLESQASQESQPASQPAPPLPRALKLDETAQAALALLRKKPMDTVELRKALRKSREHTARIMKSLFDDGLVTRDDSMKPFVYSLTGEGRRHVQ